MSAHCRTACPSQLSEAGNSAEGQGGEAARPDAAQLLLLKLKEAGLRSTSPRRRIVEALCAADRPLSLQEITELASHGFKGPDYATVFRTVSLLERYGFVQKVNLQRACSYFELHLPGKHYDHIVCTACGKVVVLDETCPLADHEKQIASRYGFTNLHHSLEFFGECGDCRGGDAPQAIRAAG